MSWQRRGTQQRSKTVAVWWRCITEKRTSKFCVYDACSACPTCVTHFGTVVWRPPWKNDVKGPILKSFEALNTRRFNFISLSKFLIHSCQFNFYTVDAHLRYTRTQNKSHLVCTIFVAHQNPFPANYTLLLTVLQDHGPVYTEGECPGYKSWNMARVYMELT